MARSQKLSSYFLTNKFLFNKQVEGCGYQSILRNVMKHHQTRHSQERPFMCEFCGMKFKSKVTLRTHTRIHTNERMFKCTYCDASYIQRVGLLVSCASQNCATIRKIKLLSITILSSGYFLTGLPITYMWLLN